MKYKASPYINTVGDEEFKDFITSKFNPNMLFNIGNDPLVNVVFNEWRGKDMGKWNKYFNEDGVILEFYPDYFTIQNKTNKVTIPLPNSINDFINDMIKYDIQLYWSDWIVRTYDPKQFLNKNEIRDYYVDLLGKMEKSHELL